MVKNPPANAGDMGTSPGPGRSHMPQSNYDHKPQLLSPRATTTAARVPRARAPHQREATVMRSPRTTTKSSPHPPQPEKALMQQQRPNAAINK